MIELHLGDCLDVLRAMPDNSIHCCVTSPPYWGLRDYGHDGQIGLEDTPEAYVARMVEVFREVRRVLRDDGTLWLNLGDSYAANKGDGYYRNQCGGLKDSSQGKALRNQSFAQKMPPGLKPKDLVGIPWRVAFALQSDGWWLRQDIIWHKPNPMPESVTDRCTKSHEYVFLLTKRERYFYDAEAVKEAFADERQGNPGTYRWKYGEGAGKGKGLTSLLKDDGMVHGWNKDGKSTGRNRRSVWTITTKPYSGAHFAVMPTDLVEPCIKAGTSEKGCCPSCGNPWERVVERYGSTYQERKESAIQVDWRTDTKDRKGRAGEVSTTTTGWRSTCTCGGDPVPCTVLDPFSGSGTVGVVSTKLSRNYIGIELNPKYLALSEQRLNGVQINLALST